MELCLVKLGAGSERLALALGGVQEAYGERLQEICGAKAFSAAAESGKLRGKRLLFAVHIPAAGVEAELYETLGVLQDPQRPHTLAGSVGGVIIDGESELYTKDAGRRLIFAANMAGCRFPGKPLVEATGSLRNFKVLARLWQTDLAGAYRQSCRLLADKIMAKPQRSAEHILVIHAGNRATSNSLALWHKVAAALGGRAEIEEISVRNGQIWDCRGCKYEECKHFGEQGNCFYGGVMTEKVYPAILRADVLVLVCPNYNDSVSANIMAFINRLTAVFRAHDVSFSQKQLYAVIVSGYSGGDLVAQQIIGALNINKNFALPPSFALLETANDPGEIEAAAGIDARAAQFAAQIAGAQDCR